MRISDWSSDVCSSDLGFQSQFRARLFCWIEGVDEIKTLADTCQHAEREHIDLHEPQSINIVLVPFNEGAVLHRCIVNGYSLVQPVLGQYKSAHMLRQMARELEKLADRSEEHTSELQSLMRISYAVFCLKKKKKP